MYYTLKEEIKWFLNLHDNFFKNRPVAPEILTEQGIQKVLKCDLSLVSRILHKLEEQEFIYGHY